MIEFTDAAFYMPDSGLNSLKLSIARQNHILFRRKSMEQNTISPCLFLRDPRSLDVLCRVLAFLVLLSVKLLLSFCPRCLFYEDALLVEFSVTLLGVLGRYNITALAQALTVGPTLYSAGNPGRPPHK
nr:hypothetical protein [Gammaproteobacteria bacterium]